MNKKSIRIAFVFLSAFLTAGIGAVSAQTGRPTITVGKPTATPKISPTPKPTPTVAPTPVAAQTLADLQAKIRSALAARPELRRGSVGVKIVALDTGKVIFEENSEKYFMPASNMKNFTVAAAIERLSPNFRFATSVFANAKPDADGAIKGDLVIFGRGDISISTAFTNGDYFKALDALVEKIAQAGVKRIEGNLVGDDSYFSGSAIPESWEWDDLQWYWGAEVSALPINDNAVDLSVDPASATGGGCIVKIQPFNPVMRVVNRCTTSAAGAKRELTVKKDFERNILEISGTMPAGGEGFKNSITVSRPAELFVALLRQRLSAKNIAVTGQTRVVGAKEKAALTAAASVPQVEIARLESAPMSLIAAKTMKPSQNMFTETLLWTLGEQGGNYPVTLAVKPEENPFLDAKSTSSRRGIFVVKNFLNQIGVPADAVVQWDGSGLSRHNLVTPASVVALYAYMAKQSRYAQAWRDSLTVGAVDGTLRGRFANTSAANNVRGKTGTIDQVSALSGYVKTAGGEQIVFSIIVNGVTTTRVRTGTIDEIVVALADYNGKLN